MAISTGVIPRGSLQLLAIYRKRPVVGMYMTLGLTLLTITFFAVFAIRPTAITIFNLINELNTKRQLTVTLDGKISALFAAQSTYADALPRLGVLDEALPQGPSLGGFAEQVQFLAAVRQVKVRSMSFEQFNLLGGPAPAASVKEKKPSGEFASTSYPFTLAIIGPYSSLYGFLADMESLRRVVGIKSFGLAGSQGENNAATLTLTISGSVFSLGARSNQTQ